MCLRKPKETYPLTLDVRYLSTPYIIAARPSDIISEVSVPGEAFGERSNAYPRAPPTTATARPTKGLPTHSANETAAAMAAHSTMRSGSLGKYCTYAWDQSSTPPTPSVIGTTSSLAPE